MLMAVIGSAQCSVGSYMTRFLTFRNAASRDSGTAAVDRVFLYFEWQNFELAPKQALIVVIIGNPAGWTASG
ncbi:MAG: hypothetical protein BECKG1743D_GA0114223_102282 [Candidatus Kentron sp. G]|nr:MAG: hypothetical protein BECKG1743F_GA0114225_102752 [Candidatus Kentron sp. G]VFM98874.1 MAG: hypothetical protein BECKG1743E_GA0114224_102152 [Candidatus Kentron sp. G]VFN00840.1 MAG: hypothetical protein BECKG1743D_GA0114223_102282 [Candidatus Kentron sp. G]